MIQNSFRNRLIIVFLFLLTLVQLATAAFVLSATLKDNRQQQKQSLVIGTNVFAEMLLNRSIQLNQSLSVLSADFGFKRAVATKEQDTIESVLSNHGMRIGAAAAILLSPDGRLLSSSLAQLQQRDIDSLFKLTQSANSDFAVLNFDHASYQFVLQPVKAPTLIAWVGMGFLLDASVANQAKRITGIDISFVNQSGERIEMVSTLPPTQQQSVLKQLQEVENVDSTVQDNLPLDYLSVVQQLDKHGLNQWAILHQSVDKWQQNYLSLRNNMLLIFAITSLLAFAIATWFARGLTRPIYSLVNFARRVGQGENPDKIDGAPAELQVLADTLSIMRGNIETRENALLYQSQHDALTGLYNRFAAKQLLTEKIGMLNGCLVLLDIKHFRHINDIIGFANADKLLLLFSQRLATLSDDIKLIARLDGDSFLLLFGEPLTEKTIEQFLLKLAVPFTIEGSKISLTVRAGMINLVNQYHNIDTLLRHGEIALNHACLSNLSVAEYQVGTDEKYQRELALVRELPEALSDRQLHLVYQPKINIQQGICYGAEALIRWQHPTLGFIPPDEFIQLAENSGNISIVSEWVISEAVSQLVKWHAEGLDLSVAINLSAHDLIDESLPARICSQLTAHGLPRSSLAIEVTEGAVMTDTQAAIDVLTQFKDLGIHVSIDDFGTGHSSLAYLKMLPVDEVKIDRSFIKDIHLNDTDLMIVQTSIQLIKGLNLSVVAEGVESIAGIDILRKLQCDSIQGYVYAKPLKAPDFRQWVQKFNSVTKPVESKTKPAKSETKPAEHE